MTKEEFIAKYGDELTGLLLAAFAEEEKNRDQQSIHKHAATGRFMIDQMKRARAFLLKVHDDLTKKPPEKKT